MPSRVRRGLACVVVVVFASAAVVATAGCGGSDGQADTSAELSVYRTRGVVRMMDDAVPGFRLVAGDDLVTAKGFAPDGFWDHEPVAVMANVGGDLSTHGIALVAVFATVADANDAAREMQHWILQVGDTETQAITDGQPGVPQGGGYFQASNVVGMYLPIASPIGDEPDGDSLPAQSALDHYESFKKRESDTFDYLIPADPPAAAADATSGDS
jgi:hypothetical protein